MIKVEPRNHRLYKSESAAAEAIESVHFNRRRRTALSHRAKQRRARRLFRSNFLADSLKWKATSFPMRFSCRVTFENTGQPSSAPGVFEFHPKQAHPQTPETLIAPLRSPTLHR
jgi:hypothetical protein